MKIIEEGQDQALLCVGYDFSNDCQSEREAALRRFGRGVNVKRWWNYSRVRFGLRVLVAYEGARPVGQVEFMPIEHAPFPVRGAELTFVNCLYVARPAQRRGVGSALLEACEAEARRRARGLAVIAYPNSPFMPAGFFLRRGFSAADQDDSAWLMFKAWGETAEPPAFLPRRSAPPAATRPGRAVVDYYWCGHCPYLVRTLDWLRVVARGLGDAVTIREVNTDDRAVVEQLGIAAGFYVNGQPAFSYPPTEAQIRLALESAVRGGAQTRADSR